MSNILPLPEPRFHGHIGSLIGPDNKRLVEIWNGLAGAKSVTKFANPKSATERIWKAIQSLRREGRSAYD